MIYTDVLGLGANAVRSPLDALGDKTTNGVAHSPALGSPKD